MRCSTILPGFALVSLTLNACAPMVGPATGVGGDPVITSFSDQECQSATTAIGLDTAASPHLCLALNALAESVGTPTNAVDIPIVYPTVADQYAGFNAVLAATLKAKSGNPENAVEVTFTPGLDVDKVRSLQPPYVPTPIQLWLQEVKASGGKVCKSDAPQGFVALAIYMIGDRIVHWLSSRAKAEAAKRALQTADAYDVVVYATPPEQNGANGNKIPSLKFIPRTKQIACGNGTF